MPAVRVERRVTDTFPLARGALVVRGVDGDDGPVVLRVATGERGAPYEVTTVLLSGRPTEPEPGWDDVVEVSLRVAGPLVVTEETDDAPRLPLVDRPGEHRLRLSASGRRRNPDAAAEGEGADGDGPDGEHEEDLGIHAPPSEWYLLEVWPEPASSPALVRLRRARRG